MSRAPVVWASTDTSTRGGVASYIRTMRDTPLWDRWSVVHVATHQDGSTADKVTRFLRGALRYVALLVLRRPALVHLHTSARGSFVRKSALTWLARARGVPVVMHVHGGGFADFHDRAPAPLRHYIRRTLEATEAVVALAPSWVAPLQRLAPRARVVVVPNAVSPVAEPTVHDPADPVVVLFLGAVNADKGVPVLLDAWARVTAGEHPVAPRLVVAGDGELERLRAQARDLGVADSVSTPGWVGPGQVDALLREAQVLVLPSRWEGLPMAVLEAMAHGVCVVATAVGGLPDLVDETCGLLVPPDDVEALAGALTQVLADPAARARLGAGGLRRIREEFDVDVTWRQLDDLYRDVLR